MPATIDLIDAQLLKVAAPETPAQLLAQWADPIKVGCNRFGIVELRPIAALLAQGAHESCGFSKMVENLNYSAERLCAVWPHRFPTIAKAQPYAHNPEKLANSVYANRMGNGPPESGDGWRNRGRGLFEITGHDNYAELAEAMAMSLDDVRPWLETINGAAVSACWFFQRHGLIDLAKTPRIIDDTLRVNGGLEGLSDRQRRFDAVVAALLRRGA